MFSRESFERYDRALQANVVLAERDLSKVMSSMSGMSNDDVRDTLLEAYPALVTKYGDQAAAVAVEFYEEQRGLAGVESDYEAVMAESASAEVSQRDVRYAMGGMYDGSSTLSGLGSQLSGMMTRRVMQGADDTISLNKSRDPACRDMRLIPHPGACAWCVMMSSREFVGLQGFKRHTNCRCTPVCEFEPGKTAVSDEFDPAEMGDELYSKFKEADTSENIAKFRSEWNSMSKEEKSKYVRRYTDKHGVQRERVGDWSIYRRNRTMQELNVRLGNTKATRIDAANSKEA